MAAAGRSPNKHPRTGSEEDSVDIAALLDRAADRFSARMDTKSGLNDGPSGTAN